jgi:hypothetical protein
MKLLFITSIVSLSLTACDATRNLSYQHADEAGTITLSFLIDTKYSQPGLNDVLSACNSVKPFRSFNLNYVMYDRMELKLMYDNLSASQQQQIFSQLNQLGVRVMNTTY